MFVQLSHFFNKNQTTFIGGVTLAMKRIKGCCKCSLANQESASNMASRNSLVLLLCLFIAVLASVSAASQRSPLIPRDTEETVEDPEDIEDDPETLEDEPEQDEDESEQDEYEPDPYEDEPEQDEDSGPSTEKPATGSLLKFLKKTIEFLKKALGKAEKTGQVGHM